MASETGDDDRRWAEAQSILARTPTESAEQRLRRWRSLELLFVTSVILLSAALGAVVMLLLPHAAHVREPSTAQAATGIVISSVGVLLSFAGLVAQLRAVRRAGGWRSPMSVLTRGQRKDLLEQVRGRRSSDPEHLPLARHLAELLLTRRGVLVLQIGLLLNVLGQWVLSPSAFRAVLACLVGLSVVAAGPFAFRDIRHAQRFLEEHPAPVG